jgi:hypothetical protein
MAYPASQLARKMLFASLVAVYLKRGCVDDHAKVSFFRLAVKMLRVTGGHEFKYRKQSLLEILHT